MAHLIPWNIEDEPVLIRITNFDADSEWYDVAVLNGDEEEIDIEIPDADALHREVMKQWRERA